LESPPGLFFLFVYIITFKFAQPVGVLASGVDEGTAYSMELRRNIGLLNVYESSGFEQLARVPA
jgi:hypothetical protein